MSVRVEMLPWERQPREAEEAYAAFLAYRDLGPSRTYEAARKRLGKRPGYLKPIERWSVLRHWRQRSCAWDDHLQAERDTIAEEEAARWERRRLQALEEGWQLCRSLRAKLAQMLAFPLESPVVARSEPAEETQEVIAEAIVTPEPAEETEVRGPSRWNYATVARLSKLVVELEWAILDEALPRPEDIDPLSATTEELKAYLARHPRRATRRRADPGRKRCQAMADIFVVNPRWSGKGVGTARRFRPISPIDRESQGNAEHRFLTPSLGSFSGMTPLLGP